MTTRVLYAEDDAGTRRVIALALSKMGYIVKATKDGKEAWEALPEFHPDIVLTDLSMPEMDGAELCRRIRENGPTSSMPIIVLTSHRDVDYQVQGAEAGADAYLVKDTDLRVLNARMQALLKTTTRNAETTRREVESVQRQTLSQSVTTVAHHINNSVMAISSAARVIDPANAEHVAKLQHVCQLESRKILFVLKALKKMADTEELKSTTYVGEELMFDLAEGLKSLAGDTSK